MGDFTLLNNDGIEILFNKKIILYGASSTGERIFNLLKCIDIVPYAFCDSDRLKWGQDFLGIPIISPNELLCIDKNEKKEYKIIICSVYLHEIYNQLYNKIQKKNIYSSYAVELALEFYAHKKDNKCAKWYTEKLELRDRIWCIPEKENSFRFDDTIEKRRILQILNTEKEIILVYSHGKVGSTTIYNSIGEKYFKTHFHDMEVCFGDNGIFDASIELWYSLLENLKKRNKVVKIVCGIREPISRDISGFFQILLAYHNKDVLDFHQPFIKNIYNFLMSEITKKDNIIPKNYREYGLRELKFGRNFDWFNIELKKYFKIDIYNSDFDKESGYKIFKNDNIEVFVYKMEKLSQIEKELGIFIGDSKFCLKNANTSDKKPYWMLYRDIKNNITLPKKYVDFYYKDNICMDYFYTFEEKSRFLSEWKIE